MYAPFESHIVDLYTVSIERGPRRTSVPFICGIEIEGPRGESVRVRALEDDGAMVSAMCTALYEKERHRIGELKHSGKTLRMANGTLIPSMGFWEGYIRFGGARVRGCFEVFPSGGSWSFLFGKPLLEEFGAVHDYKADSITVPGEGGPTIVANQIGRLGQWDEARGRVHAVFLDPKSRATSAGGSSAPPVRRVPLFNHCTPKNVDGQWHETKSATREDKPTTGVPQAAQRNSTGDLPSPSREVQEGEGGERGSTTDDITLTAREPEDNSKTEDMTEGQAREKEMENSEDTRVYVPGDFPRSPLRDIPEKTHAFRSTSSTDSIFWAGPVTGVTQALRMVGLILIWGIFVLAAQYGGDESKTSTRGTLSGDPESPSREVPAPDSVLEKVLVTDTAMPVIYLNKDWRTRRRYTRKENEKRMKIRRNCARKRRVTMEEEPQETAEEDPNWQFRIPRLFEVRVHGKVVRPKRPARRDSVGDSDDSPMREVPDLAHDTAEEIADASAPETTYTVEEIAEHLVRAAKESRVWEELKAGSPENFAAYLVQVTADANAGEAPQQYATDEGAEQPEIEVGGDISVFTRLTDPHNPKRVAAIQNAVMIGPDLTGAQRSTVRDFITEFADCYALSMKEVIPIPGAEHTMNIPKEATFNTKVHQRPTTPAQKSWYNGVIDEMLEAGIIAGIDPKEVKCVSPTTLAQKAHQNGKTRTILELQHQINDQCTAAGLPPSFNLPQRPATTPETDDPAKPSWRVCHDYRELNGKTKVATMPQGDIQRKQGLLSGHRWISVFDFAKGFYACATAEEIRPYLCFYVEGRGFFTQPAEHSGFGGNEGNRVGPDGIKPDLTKLTAIVDWDTPHDLLNLKSFLGLCGHFRD
ncbi:hypothetical protein B0H10DRAFT_2233705 [Mycena sp. CBHHK59/15]|nr:hypothetical protein B0H10DRAFT_2233705 [Mycena sp. CBHHK59/15]